MSTDAAGSGTKLDPEDPNVQSPAGLGADNPHAADPDLGQKQMQERTDAINEKGYIGSSPDPTPDVNYSLLTPPDAPTPETDAELAGKLDAAVRGNRLTNVELTPQQIEAGAEIPKAEGTKTPAESQTEQKPPSGDDGTKKDTTGAGDGADTVTVDLSGEELARIAELVAGGKTEDDAKAQVLSEREGHQQ